MPHDVPLPCRAHEWTAGRHRPSDFGPRSPSAPSPPASALLKTAEQLRWGLPQDFRDRWVENVYAESARIAERRAVKTGASTRLAWERRLDRFLTSRWTGYPTMILMLGLVLWITIEGANVPSALLASLLVEHGHPWLNSLAAAAGLPGWISGPLIDGVYLTTAWVVSVMLPPMAIFFPLFTILEDFGYLPRVAFNLDHWFRRVGAHGKQALTMSMGWGCNAAGVVATRVIDSPRERLIAIVLWRAIVFAAPAGLVLWLISNVHIGSATIADHMIRGLDPLGWAIGLNGVILVAYLIAIPANEIVIPTVLMLTVMATGATGVGEQGAGVMFEIDDDLHDLQGDAQREMDRRRHTAADRLRHRDLRRRGHRLAPRREMTVRFRPEGDRT